MKRNSRDLRKIFRIFFSFSFSCVLTAENLNALLAVLYADFFWTILYPEFFYSFVNLFKDMLPDLFYNFNKYILLSNGLAVRLR